MRYVLINTLPIAVSFRGVHVLLHLLIPLKKDPVQSGLNDPTKKGRGPLIHNSLRLWSLLSNSRKEKSFSWRSEVVNDKLTITLQGINISHLGKRKIIFKMPFLVDMLVPWRVYTVSTWRKLLLFVSTFQPKSKSYYNDSSI